MLRALQNQRRRSAEDGFTLIELLIVIVILGVLAAIVVFSVAGITDKSKESACKADVATVTTAAEAYYANNGTGQYAADVDALVTAGLLHSNPGDVTYSADNTSTPKTVSVAGAAGSACAGYTD